jgi:hypothetical protein
MIGKTGFSDFSGFLIRIQLNFVKILIKVRLLAGYPFGATAPLVL